MASTSLMRVKIGQGRELSGTDQLWIADYGTCLMQLCLPFTIRPFQDRHRFPTRAPMSVRSEATAAALHTQDPDSYLLLFNDAPPKGDPVAASEPLRTERKTASHISKTLAYDFSNAEAITPAVFWIITSIRNRNHAYRCVLPERVLMEKAHPLHGRPP
jgi:hypothetical protein